MALSDKRILEEMKKGDIVIYPFDQGQLAASSYDVTLGEYFFRSNLPSTTTASTTFGVVSTWSMYGVADKVERAVSAKEAFKKYNFEFGEIHEDDKVIVLRPASHWRILMSSLVGKTT